MGQKWCGAKTGISCRPADPYFVALYLNRGCHVFHTLGGGGEGEGGGGGHRAMGFTSPTENSLVKLAYDGA